MNLYNALPTPLGIRLCYWHPDYQPEYQLFHASKMTDQENRAFFAFEDLLAYEKHEKNKSEAAGGDKAPLGPLDDKAEALSIDGQTLRLKTGKKEKNSYFLEKKFLSEMDSAAVWVSNTQTNGGTVPKMAINRRDFLAR